MLSSLVLCLATSDLGQKGPSVRNGFHPSGFSVAFTTSSTAFTTHCPHPEPCSQRGIVWGRWEWAGLGPFAKMQKIDIRRPWCKEDSWNESRSLKKIISNKEILSWRGHNLSAGEILLEIRHNNLFNISTWGSPESQKGRFFTYIRSRRLETGECPHLMS